MHGDLNNALALRSNVPSLATAQQSLKALDLLKGWQPHETLPAVRTADLQQSILGLASLLEPASPEAFAVALDKLFAFARAFNVPADAAVLTPLYRDGLVDLPSDLLVEAVARVTRSWKWGNRLPMPGDLRAAVEPEMFERVRTHGRHRVALRFAQERETAAQRKPLATAPVPPALPPKPPLLTAPDDGKPEIDLGNTAERIAGWERGAA